MPGSGVLGNVTKLIADCVLSAVFVVWAAVWGCWCVATAGVGVVVFGVSS